MHSKFIASEFIEKLYGGKAAALVTALVLWTAFASLFALLLGYSRIPYAAAINGHFFKSFARLHPTGRFPYVSLLVMGALSIVASLWPLDQVIAHVFQLGCVLGLRIFGIPESPALAYSIIVHLSQFVGCIAAGLYSMWSESISLREVEAAEQVNVPVA